MSNLFNPAPGASFDEKGNVVDAPETAAQTEVEAPTEAVVTLTEEKKPVDTITTNIVASPEINWESELTSRTGGKYKSWEELTTRLSEEKQDIAFTNDESKRIFDYLREGKVDDVLQVYNEQKRLASLKTMTDADVVKLAMEYKQVGLKDDDIHEEFLAKYQLEKPEAPNPDEYLDEDAQAKAEKIYEKDLKRYEKEQKSLDRKLKQEAVEARDYLDSLKKDIVLPEINTIEKDTEADEAEIKRRAAEAKQERDLYLNSLDKSFNEFKEIPLKVTDEGVSFDGKFEIDEAERQQLKKDLTEKNVLDDLLLSRYIKEDGYDTKQLMEDLYWLQNKEKIISSAIKQALSKGKLENIKETKNIDLEAGHKENFEPSKEAEFREFSKKFFQAR